MAKALKAKPSKQKSKPLTKPAKLVKPTKQATANAKAPVPSARASKQAPKRGAKSLPARAVAAKRVVAKALKPVRRAAAAKGSKLSKVVKTTLKKSTAARKGISVGSKIAIGASGAVLAAAGAAAIRNASRGKNIDGTNKSAAKPQSKKVVMPTNLKENQKEVSPGGGIVLPATRTAPAMRLRADDAEILATAKERYGRKDLESFRKLIVEQQQEAREEFDILSQNILDTSGEFEADNQTYSLHTAEQGSDAIEREKTFLHAQRTSDYIKKLEEALERIERGTYGICVICGGLIQKERLQAVPITQKHVDCKNKTQVRKVGSGGGFHDVEEQPVNLD